MPTPMRAVVPLLTLAAVASGSPATAQATHVQLTPAVAPAARAGIHGVSDHSVMWVFGGLTAAGSPPTFSDEMWRFDGATWTNATPAVSPPARDWYASAWDFARGRYVLFGGRVVSGTTTTDIGDTWEFDGTTWTQVATAVAPSPRRWSAMVFDLVLGTCVLFGGSSGGTTFLNDTWTWDGAAWIQLTPATSPSPRARGWLEYDSTRGRAIYFGGKDSTAATALGETWSWDGATWTQLPTATVPGWNGGPGLIAYGMSYDPFRDRMVLVGGTRTSASVSPQTWEFDGGDWILRPVGAMTGRTAPAVAFVVTPIKTFVFGGSGGVNPTAETFEYQTNAWPTVATFGTDCQGMPASLSVHVTQGMWIGETTVIEFSNLDPAAICLGVVGFSNATWNGVPLPFPLSLVFATTTPTCELQVSPDAIAVLPNVGGVASLALAVPNDPLLIGFQLYEQALQFDLNFVWSATGGAALQFGAK